jgi:hypothetical protein
VEGVLYLLLVRDDVALLHNLERVRLLRLLVLHQLHLAESACAKYCELIQVLQFNVLKRLQLAHTRAR